MTQEWIDQFNKKCAEFLGYVNTTPADKDFNIYKNEKGMIIGNKIYTMLETMSMKFHSDWNWIMEVVEAIEKLGYWVCIQNTYIGFGNKNDENAFLNYSFSSFRTTKREAVIQAIDQFIDWHNEQKKA